MKSIHDAIVLIVDDTEENIEILVDALGDKYEVSVAMDGNSALEAIAEELPDIVLLDVMMPEMDGYEVCRRLKASPRTSSIPVIFLTALSNIEDKTKGFEAGAVDYITKPFEISEVKARVSTHLSLYLLSLELEEQKKIAEAHTRTKTEFLATMSHEIRTPMNGVLGMAQLLLETPLNKKQRKFAETIYDSGKALLAIINDILDLSKLEVGKFELEQIPFSSEKLIHSVKNLMLNRSDEKGLTFDIEIAENVPKVVLGDAARIRQILLNFLSNAIKFTGKGGVKITHSLQDHDTLYFSVVDTGIGINEEGKKKLFQDFTQVDSSISRKYGGTGLGLSICRRIISMMNGAIGVNSTLGHGSEFWFTIPCILTDMQELEANESAVKVVLNRRHVRILIAEDNIVNQQVTIGMLGGEEDFDITIAENGVEAVKACEEHDFDVVLMDVQMPDMDGMAATKMIRKLAGEMANVPVIAVTASAVAADRQECLAAGMNGFVTKPLDADLLIKEIAKVTGFATAEKVEQVQTKHETNFFDSEQLLRLEQSISRDGIIAILQGYLAEIFPLCEKLAALAANSEWEKLSFDAHKIKGASINLGMAVLANLAGEIEKLASNADYELSRRKVREISLVLSKTLDEARVLYPEAFIDDNCKDKDEKIEGSIANYILDCLGAMKEAIKAESQAAFMKASKELLAIKVPECLVEKLGDIAKYVVKGKYLEAELYIEKVFDLLGERIVILSEDNTSTKGKLESLKRALVLAKPKSIIAAVEALEKAQLPPEIKEDIKRVINQINTYNYKDALEIINACLRGK